MSSTEPTLSPDVLTDVQRIRQRITDLERSPRYSPRVVASVPLGVRQNSGFETADSTSFVDLFRADVFLTAPILDYDIQLGDFGTGVTSIEWQISAHFDAQVTVVASGTGVGTNQFTGKVDMLDASVLGIAARDQLVRIDVEAKRTGGSGQAGLRLLRPLAIRISNT